MRLSAANRLSVVILAALLLTGPARAQQPGGFRVVDTGLDRCYGNTGEIDFPKAGQPFYGQDAQYQGPAMAYKDNRDGTIADLNTGLTWQKTPDFVQRSWEKADAYAKSLELAGHNDWRLPTIKELFSLVDFRGNMRTKTPYLDTRYFAFEYPDPSTGARDMDAQYWSSNRYLGTTMRGDQSAFGFNFADGRIKSYPTSRRRRGGKRGGLYVRCVRGPAYGNNDFVDNRDGTISDRATGLMWTKADSGRTMNWEKALSCAENLKLAGHKDWRLPNVKELQSIVDYSRAPDARQAAKRGPAIAPVFDLTKTESWFWSGSTHIENSGGYYVCFGQAFSALEWRGKQVNAHGAGAVRSDPKTGDPGKWKDGKGPQSDEIRILNFVRCVRLGEARLRTAPASSLRPSRPPRGGQERGQERGPSGAATGRFIGRLDRDGDGKVSRAEFDGPKDHFRVLDRNGDGYLSADEAPSGPPPGGGRGRGRGGTSKGH